MDFRQIWRFMASTAKRSIPGLRLLIFAVTIFACENVWAQRVSELYTISELQTIGDRYRPRLRGIWQEDFLSRLSRDERAQPVTLDIPLIGENDYILDFYSYPDRRQVVLPVASIKFLDDMTVAYAYYEKNGCDVGLVSDYAAVLRFQHQHARGSPLDVLGVPRTAVDDQYVDDLAQKLLKSIVFFVAAHEYAHVLYQHRAITVQQAQQNEIEADTFALDIMRRIGVPPVGVTFFFLIDSRLEKTPGDFPSSAAYELYLRQVRSHPVSALRILKIADGIQVNAQAFARLQQDQLAWEKKLQLIVQDLRVIAGGLDDRRMRQFLKERAENLDVATLQHACSVKK